LPAAQELRTTARRAAGLKHVGDSAGDSLGGSSGGRAVLFGLKRTATSFAWSGAQCVESSSCRIRLADAHFSARQ